LKIRKNGNYERAIAFGKSTIWVKYSNCKNMPKTCEKPYYKNIRVVLGEKPLEKTPNIREMRQF